MPPYSVAEHRMRLKLVWQLAQHHLCQSHWLHISQWNISREVHNNSNKHPGVRDLELKLYYLLCYKIWKKNNWGWGERSVSEVLALQVPEPECIHQNPCKGKADRRTPGAAHQPASLNCLTPDERTCCTGGWCSWGRQRKLPFGWCTHTCAEFENSNSAALENPHSWLEPGPLAEGQQLYIGTLLLSPPNARIIGVLYHVQFTWY